MITLESYVTVHEGVVGQRVEEEAVLVLAKSGRIQVLNDVGARIWELADGTRTLATIAATIHAEYQVELPQAQADSLAFVAGLAADGAMTAQEHYPESG